MSIYILSLINPALKQSLQMFYKDLTARSPYETTIVRSIKYANPSISVYLQYM